MKKEDIAGFEAKHITYVEDQFQRKDDLLVVKEVIHLKDGSRVPRLRLIENYQRPYWVTHKGRRNHQEKKDYEYTSNLMAYKSTQIDLVRNMAKSLGVNPYGQNSRQRVLQRSPYIYGSDVSSSACLKAQYRKSFPDALSLNTVAGGDIETDVVEGTDDIICMSVSHKENVRLVYLKHWIKDIQDPVGETLEEAKRLIPELIEERNLNIEVIIADTPSQVVMRCIEKLHEWKPDWFTFWNIDFDMSKIIRQLEKENISLSAVFSDPSIPDKYKFFDYRKGPTQKVTASGKTMSINVEDRWNWVTHPASFQCIDSMAVYRVTRLANGKDPSYALSYILQKELNQTHSVTVEKPEDVNEFLTRAEQLTKGKGGFIYYHHNDQPVKQIDPASVQVGDTLEVELDFDKLRIPEIDHLKGLDWHKAMQKDHKIVYGVYNIVDSIRLEQLDEKTKDLASSITMYSRNSDFKNFNSNPKRLVDDMHFWYLDRENPCVIGTASDEMEHELDQNIISHRDWIITLPSYMDSGEGAKVISEFPDYQIPCYPFVADLDLQKSPQAVMLECALF